MTTEPTTTEPTTPQTPETTRGVRMRTVIWGLVLAACGVAVIAASAGRTFDLGLVTIVVLAVAGAALLVASLVRGLRRS